VDFATISDYDSNLATAVSTIGSTEITLYIDETVTVAANVTVPSTLTLAFTRSGELAVSTGYTVILNGPIEAGKWTIFSGAGSFTIPAGFVAKAEWFGGVETAVSKIGSVNCTLTAESAQTLSDDLSVGSNIVLDFSRGVTVSAGSAKTLTSDSPILMGRWQWIGSNVTYATSSDTAQHFMYPEWWGIDGVNDQTEINYAITCAATGYNGITMSCPVVDLAAKVYAIDGAILVNKSGLTLSGKGYSTGMHRATGSTWQTILVAPTDPTNDALHHITIENMVIYQSSIAQTSGGAHLKIESTADFSVRNIKLTGAYSNIIIKGSNAGTITDFVLYHADLFGAFETNSSHVVFSKGTNATLGVNPSGITLSDGNLSGSTDYYFGIGVLINAADGLTFSNLYIGRSGGKGVYVDPSPDNFIDGLYFNNCFFDNCGDTGHSIGVNFQLAGSSTDWYSNINIHDCNFWTDGTVRGTNGLYINGAPTGVTVDGCKFSGFYNQAINVANASASQIAIRNCVIFGNNKSNGAISGILFATGHSEFVIQNNFIGRSGDSPAQNYPVIITSGCSYYTITGNHSQGNTSDAISYNAGDTGEVVVDNSAT